jgi:hypothetical protein
VREFQAIVRSRVSKLVERLGPMETDCREIMSRVKVLCAQPLVSPSDIVERYGRHSTTGLYHHRQ